MYHQVDSYKLQVLHAKTNRQPIIHMLFYLLPWSASSCLGMVGWIGYLWQTCWHRLTGESKNDSRQWSSSWTGRCLTWTGAWGQIRIMFCQHRDAARLIKDGQNWYLWGARVAKDRFLILYLVLIGSLISSQVLEIWWSFWYFPD